MDSIPGPGTKPHSHYSTSHMAKKINEKLLLQVTPAWPITPLLLEKEAVPCRCPGAALNRCPGASDPPPHRAEPAAPLHPGSTAQGRWGASRMASPLAQQGVRLALLESHPGLEGQESDPASRPPAVQKMHCTAQPGQAASPSLGIRAASKQTRARRGRVSPSD